MKLVATSFSSSHSLVLVEFLGGLESVDGLYWHMIYIRQFITGIGKALHWDGTRVSWVGMCWPGGEIFAIFFTPFSLILLHLVRTADDNDDDDVRRMLFFIFFHKIFFSIVMCETEIESIFLKLINKKNFSSIMVFYDPQDRSTSPPPCPNFCRKQ